MHCAVKKIVRELLTHSDYDPVQIVTVSVSISSPVAFSEQPYLFDFTVVIQAS